MDPNTLNYAPLTQKLTRAELWGFTKQRYFSSALGSNYVGILFIGVLAPLLGFFFLLFFTTMNSFLVAIFLNGAPDHVKFGVIALSSFGGMAISTVLLGWAITRSIRKSLRYKKFAEANRLEFLEFLPDPDGRARGRGNNNQSGVNPHSSMHPGLLFQYGHTRLFDPGFGMPGPGKIVFGNYQYTTGSGKSSKTHRIGFVRCTLSRKLPQVVLDATNNNFMKRFSNLSDLNNNQKIEVEGDFNNFFDVYCPKDYERDTLYWLTPELMELLKKYLSSYDVELVDNYVYAYSAKPFDIQEPTIRSLIGLGDWMYHEFEENTDRYADERVGSFTSNVVSESGRRLRKNNTWFLTLLVVVVYVIFRIWLSNR